VVGGLLSSNDKKKKDYSLLSKRSKASNASYLLEKSPSYSENFVVENNNVLGEVIKI